MIRNPITHHSKEVLASLALGFIVLACYWPAGQYGFVNYDDPLYITENPYVQRGVTLEGISWAFKDMQSSNWHPLTWLSHMLDWELFGSNAGGHHWVNVILHLFNVLLLFYLLRGLTGALWRSACVALFFAIHPMNVESVAWVAERKNLLSTALGLITLLFYGTYVRKPEWKWYLAMCVTFALCLMAKPMLVTMPFLLLLLDYWPCRRLGLHKHDPASPATESVPVARLLLEKVPLIIISAASIIMTIWAAAAGGALKSLDHFPLSVRVANSLNAYAGYIGKLFWPRDLAVFYPHPGFLPTGETVAAGLLIGGLTLWIVAKRRGIPYLTVGGFWFLGTLVPVIGLVQVGMQAMADRYVYVPYIGLFIILVWGGMDVSKTAETAKGLLVFTAGLAVLFWGVTAHQQLRYWQSSRSLFTHALLVNPENAIAHNNLAHALFEEGNWDGAIAHYEQAIRIDPRYANAYNNLGAVLARQGRTAEAIVQYRNALDLNPGHAGANFHLGLAMESLGRFNEADHFYDMTLRMDPHHHLAKRQRGMMALRGGKYDQAVHFFQEVLREHSGDSPAKEALFRAVAGRQAQEKRLDPKRH